MTSEPTVYKGNYILDVEGKRVYVTINNIYHYGDYVVIRDHEATKIRTGQPQSNIFLTFRQSVQKVYKTILRPREADIISGMVLGADDMGDKLKNEMANAGLIHLVVASGMNLTLVGGFVFALFTGLHLHRRSVVLIASGAVICYAAVAGFNPPIVRALIMFEAVMLGGLVGRKSGGLFALIAAGYLMLWVNPSLTTSYSFLLSFASMMGQIFLSTIKLSLPAVIEACVLVVLQNLLALVFTAPIILIGFSRFSPISIISNLFITWMVEPLMIVGGFAGIIGLGSMELARFLLIPVSLLLEFFLFIVDVFGGSEKYVVHVEGFNIFIAIGYYLLLGASIYKIRHHGEENSSNTNAN